MLLPFRMVRMISMGIELASEFQTTETGHDLIQTVDLVEAGYGVSVDTGVIFLGVGVWDVGVFVAWEADETSAVFLWGVVC